MQQRRRSLFAKALIATTLAACAGAPGTGGTPSAAPSGTAPAAPSARAASTPSARPQPTLPPGVTAMHDTPFRASGITTDDRYIWAEDHALTNAVYAVDPETGATVGTVDLQRPCDVAVADGAVWAADLDAGKVVAIDPATFEVVDEVGGLHGPCGLQSTGGLVWLAVDEGLARLDPGALTVTVADFGGAAFPGSGTPLWAAFYGTGELSRIDLDTGDRTVRVPAPGRTAELIAVTGAFDALWAGNEATSHVYKLDPATGETLAVVATSAPSRLLASESGLWVTSYAAGTVERIDPATLTVVYRVRLGGSPNGITQGFGSIWVSDTANGRFFAIDPTATGFSE